MNKHIQVKLIVFITLFINLSCMIKAAGNAPSFLVSQGSIGVGTTPQDSSPQKKKEHLVTALSKRRSGLDYSLKMVKWLNDLENLAEISDTLAFEEDTIWIPLFIQFLQQKELTKVCQYTDKIESFSDALLLKLDDQDFNIELSEIKELQKALSHFEQYKPVEELLTALRKMSTQLQELDNQHAQAVQKAEETRRAQEQAQQDQEERERAEELARIEAEEQALLQAEADAAALQETQERERREQETKEAEALKAREEVEKRQEQERKQKELEDQEEVNKKRAGFTLLRSTSQGPSGVSPRGRHNSISDFTDVKMQKRFEELQQKQKDEEDRQQAVKAEDEERKKLSTKAALEEQKKVEKEIKLERANSVNHVRRKTAVDLAMAGGNLSSAFSTVAVSAPSSSLAPDPLTSTNSQSKAQARSTQPLNRTTSIKITPLKNGAPSTQLPAVPMIHQQTPVAPVSTHSHQSSPTPTISPVPLIIQQGTNSIVSPTESPSTQVLNQPAPSISSNGSSNPVAPQGQHITQTGPSPLIVPQVPGIQPPAIVPLLPRGPVQPGGHQTTTVSTPVQKPPKKKNNSYVKKIVGYSLLTAATYLLSKELVLYYKEYKNRLALP